MAPTYDITNWYWIVGNSKTEVYSSAAVGYVSQADSTYTAWLAAGNWPTYATDTDALKQVFDDSYPAGWPQTLAQQAAAAVAAGLSLTLTGSFTLGATLFPTDPDTQLKLGNVVNIVNSTSAFPNNQATFPMRDSAGTWYNFTVPQYVAVAGAIANYVTTLVLIIDGNPFNLTALPADSVTLNV